MPNSSVIVPAGPRAPSAASTALVSAFTSVNSHWPSICGPGLLIAPPCGTSEALWVAGRSGNCGPRRRRSSTFLLFLPSARTQSRNPVRAQAAAHSGSTERNRTARYSRAESLWALTWQFSAITLDAGADNPVASLHSLASIGAFARANETQDSRRKTPATAGAIARFTGE